MKKLVHLSFLFIISGIFLYAGAIKAIDPQSFYESLVTFKLGTDKFLAFTAHFLPYLELFSAIALLIPRLRKGALVLILCQFAIFQVWLGQAWSRGLIQECPCFGAKGIDIRVEFMVNLLLISFSLYLLKTESTTKEELRS